MVFIASENFPVLSASGLKVQLSGGFDASDAKGSCPSNTVMQALEA
jgi:hypothetical protein